MIREASQRPEKSLVNALREFATTQIADCGGPVAVVAPPTGRKAGGRPSPAARACPPRPGSTT
jgi:hypothetical protein